MKTNLSYSVLEFKTRISGTKYNLTPFYSFEKKLRKITKFLTIYGTLENLIKKVLQYQFCVLRHKSMRPKNYWQHFGNPRKMKKITFFDLWQVSVILEKADLDEFFSQFCFLS